MDRGGVILAPPPQKHPLKTQPRLGLRQMFSTSDWRTILNTLQSFFRNSRPEVFCKKGVLRIFAKFTRKHLCQSLFHNTVEVCNFIKKETVRCKAFPVNFAKFLRIPIIIEHLWWLLLFFWLPRVQSAIFLINVFCKTRLLWL